MVAYSFQKRFAPSIAALTKRQTIRADRARHARLGERIQLYTGMRTKHCAKIIPDPQCVGVEPIRINVGEKAITLIELMRWTIPLDYFDEFARDDGFENVGDMHRFWLKAHGVGGFHGVLIRWQSDGSVQPALVAT